MLQLPPRGSFLASTVWWGGQSCHLIASFFGSVDRRGWDCNNNSIGGDVGLQKTRVQNLYELRLLFRLFNPLTSNGSDGLRAQLDLMLQTNGCN